MLVAYRIKSSHNVYNENKYFKKFNGYQHAVLIMKQPMISLYMVIIYYVFLRRLFEQRCIELMDSMYQEDSEHAIDLMDDEADVWGISSSPLTFAYENFMYDIVAHTCSQKLINKEWYNNLTPDFKPFLKVIASCHL